MGVEVLAPVKVPAGDHAYVYAPAGETVACKCADWLAQIVVSWPAFTVNEHWAKVLQTKAPKKHTATKNLLMGILGR